MDRLQFDGPVVLAILDGVGLAPRRAGNAVSFSRMPFISSAIKNNIHIALDASGEAVGLVPGQMGNSEVGHNTMGAGRSFKQGIARINEAFDTGKIFESVAWKKAVSTSGTLHFSGIFSDGGVHSDIKHLYKMIEEAYKEGIRKVRVHAVFDGRDVPPQSEPKYIKEFNEFSKKFKDADIKIASGGGRMTTVADRYMSDWSVVKRGFDMMVYGKADFYFKSAEEGIRELRKKDPELQDQYVPAFVVVDENDQPVGKIEKGDSLVYFDFRADRAIEIAMAFTYIDFPYFNRGGFSPEDVFFAGMTEYNSDTHVPEYRLVEPVVIDQTLNLFLAERGKKQLAVSETVKFGHITYYFNGDSYEKAMGENFIEVPSYTEPFETRPWMKSAEITDAVIKNMKDYDFVRINFPGGDMVGHTADFEATIIAMEAIDLSLARIAEEVDRLGGVLLIVADHGNAEEVLDEKGEKKTSHTTNKVPFIIYDNTKNHGKYKPAEIENPGLTNVAATIATLLGETDYPGVWDKSLVL